MASNNKTQTYDEVLALIKKSGSTEFDNLGIDWSLVRGLSITSSRFLRMHQNGEWLKYAYAGIIVYGSTNSSDDWDNINHMIIPMDMHGSYRVIFDIVDCDLSSGSSSTQAGYNIRAITATSEMGVDDVITYNLIDSNSDVILTFRDESMGGAALIDTQSPSYCVTSTFNCAA